MPLIRRDAFEMSFDSTDAFPQHLIIMEWGVRLSRLGAKEVQVTFKELSRCGVVHCIDS